MSRPEHELLIECARPETSAPLELRHPVDWDYLLEAAASTRMTSMLYRRLHSSCPAPIQQTLRNHYLMRSARNLLLTTELLKILYLYDREGIPAIPFKGPILAAALYDDPALREYNDLDVLVPPESAFRAVRLLTRLGYPAIPDFSSGVESQILKHVHHCHVDKADGHLAVEVHWTLLPSYFRLPLPMQDWWRRSEDTLFENRRIRTFCREDMLVMLAIQASKHMFQNLQWIGDLARFLHRHPDLDWDRILGTCSPDLRHIVFIAVLAAHEILGSPVPAQARSDAAAVRLAREAHRNIFSAGGKLPMLFYQFRLKPTWPGRLACFFAYLFTPQIIDHIHREAAKAAKIRKEL